MFGTVPQGVGAPSAIRSEVDFVDEPGSVWHGTCRQVVPVDVTHSADSRSRCVRVPDVAVQSDARLTRASIKSTWERVAEINLGAGCGINLGAGCGVHIPVTDGAGRGVPSSKPARPARSPVFPCPRGEGVTGAAMNPPSSSWRPHVLFTRRVCQNGCDDLAPRVDPPRRVRSGNAQGDHADAASDSDAAGQCPATQLTEALDRARATIGAAAATAVILRANCTWNGASGRADVPNDVAVRPSDRLRVGSVTKTFTAALVLQLVNEGTLGLDDVLESWVPGVANGGAISIEQLLRHTSGVADYLDQGFFPLASEQWTPEQIVAYANAKPPAFAPGTNWGYSNTNYILLGMIIERATGSSYHQQLRSRLLDPLQLADTFVEGDEDIPGGFIRGYVQQNGGYVERARCDEWVGGVGRWGHRLHRGRHRTIRPRASARQRARARSGRRDDHPHHSARRLDGGFRDGLDHDRLALRAARRETTVAPSASVPISYTFRVRTWRWRCS